MHEQTFDFSQEPHDESFVDGSDSVISALKKQHFIWWHWIFIICAVCVTLALAWWQLCRFNSISGSAQNLGYTLQWPFFGGFVVFGYLKYRALDRQSSRESPHIAPDESLGESQPKTFSLSAITRFTHIPLRLSTSSKVAHEIPAGILPSKPQNVSSKNTAYSAQNPAEMIQTKDTDVVFSAEQEIFAYNHYLQSLAKQNQQVK